MQLSVPIVKSSERGGRDVVEEQRAGAGVGGGDRLCRAGRPNGLRGEGQRGRRERERRRRPAAATTATATAAAVPAAASATAVPADAGIAKAPAAISETVTNGSNRRNRIMLDLPRRMDQAELCVWATPGTIPCWYTYGRTTGSMRRVMSCSGT